MWLQFPFFGGVQVSGVPILCSVGMFHAAVHCYASFLRGPGFLAFFWDWMDPDQAQAAKLVALRACLSINNSIYVLHGLCKTARVEHMSERCL